MWNFIIKNILLGLFLLTSLKLYAGVSTSGGGYAVVCRDQNKQIISAQLLDLVEGKNNYDLRILSSTGDALKDYIDSVKRITLLKHGHIDNIDLLIKNSTTAFFLFFSSAEWVNNSQNLEWVFDIANFTKIADKLSDNCNIEHLATFNDSKNHIQIASDIWSKLDTLSQAALVQHEVVYQRARNFILFPEVSSDSSRLNVALIFSESAVPVLNGIPNGLNEKKLFSIRIQTDF